MLNRENQNVAGSDGFELQNMLFGGDAEVMDSMLDQQQQVEHIPAEQQVPQQLPPVIPEAREETQKAVDVVTRQPEHVAKHQKKRTVEYIRRRGATEVYYPVANIEQALMRTGASNDILLDLVKIIRVGKHKVLPSELIVEKDGEKYLNLAVLNGEDQGLMRRLKSIHGAYEMFVALDKDLTLQGKHSVQVLKFKKERVKVAERMSDKVREYGKQHVDFYNELAGPDTGHAFPSEEVREKFHLMQNYCQGITDKIAAVSGLTNVIPKVYLTRSQDVNAFVWGEHGEEGIKDLLEIAKTGKQVELPIYIHLGLINVVNHDDELAGIIAHELTHIMQPNYGRNKEAEEQQRLEYDADKSAIHLCDAAGYNPRGLLQFFNKYKKKDFLARIGAYSHPETASRITELEKEYHRKDLPLINSGKSMTPKTDKIKDAIEVVNNEMKLVEDETNLGLLEAENKLDEELEKKSGPQLYFRKKFNGDVHRVAHKRLKDAYIHQEVVHGSVGYRDRMLAAMQNFVLGIKLAEQNTDPNVSYRRRFPLVSYRDTNEISSIDEYFAIPKEEKYLCKDEDIKRHQVAKYGDAEDLQKECEKQGIDFDKSGFPTTIEDWINVDNEYTDIFWKQFDENGVNDKKQRLMIFINLIRLYSFDKNDNYGGGYPSSVFGIDKTEKVIIKVPVPIEDDGNRLDKLPARFRTQQRRKDFKVEYEEIDESRSTSIFSSSGEGLRFSADLRKLEYLNQPPLIEDLATILHDKSIDAYQEVLGLDGQEQVDPRVLEFILYMFYNTERAGDINFKELLPGIMEPSISFLDQVIKVLELKNFDRTFSDLVNYKTGLQTALFRAYILIVAFALKPANDQEKSIQQEYLKRVAEDPFLVRGRTYSYALYRNADEKMMDYFDPEFVELRGSDSISLRPITPSVNANWLLYKEKIMDEMHGELEMSDQEEGNLDIREDDKKVISRDFKISSEKQKTLVARLLNRLKNSENREKDEKYKLLESKLLIAVAVVRKYLDKSYIELLPNYSSLRTQFDEERGWLSRPQHEDPPEIVRALIKEIANVLNPFISDYYEEQLSQEEVEKKLFRLFANTVSAEDQINRYQEVHYLESEDHKNRSIDNYVSNNDDRNGKMRNSDTYLLHRYKGIKLGDPAHVERETVYDWLESLASQRSKAKSLLDYLKKENIKITSGIGSLCLGNFVNYENLVKDISWKGRRERKKIIRDLIKLFRYCSEIYHEEWQHIEGYKRMDEQLSNWEWVYDNPFFGKASRYVGVRYDSDKKKNLVEYLVDDFGESLGKYYAIETGSAIKFSWPLLIEDLWNGNLNLDGINNEERREKARKIFNIIAKKLEKIISDGSNLDLIKKMQPGYFKEFILAEKIKREGKTETIAELEEWIPHFSSLPHEASENNQVTSQIEDVRHNIIDKRKDALMTQAIKEILPDDVSDDIKEMITSDYGKKYHFDFVLVEIDCDCKYVSSGLSEYAKRQEMNNAAEQVLNKYKKQILARYKELIESEINEMEDKVLADEEDIYLYSDHVIENEKSRLEVGPVYRFQLAAQPLMNWHVDKLKGAKSLAEVQTYSDKVDMVFTEKHPLKDIYLKNQLNHEIWQILRTEYSDQQLEEMDIRLTETVIDLSEVLKHFPLYKEVSFLDKYSNFKLEGLINKFKELPYKLTSRIIALVAKYVEYKASEVSKPALRRTMFLMEEKVYWDALVKRREYDPQILDNYLNHILKYYPNPSLERDNLLETIVMDLALTSEEVDNVLSLRYEEQVRLPEQKESLAVKVQFEAVEKLRLYISMMDRIERAAFTVWLMGGEPPIANSLSIQDTGFSLDGRKEIFWHMTPNERRQLLYDLLRDEKGIFRIMSWTNYTADKIPDRPFKLNTEPYSMIKHVVEQIFDVIFEGLLINDNLPPDHEENVNGRDILKTIFMGLFTEQDDPTRRAELLINIIDAIGSAKKEGKKLGTPELIRLMAEQGGVVIIKFAQVLSEQPGLLPDSIKNALGDLKDAATIVSKKSDISYLQAMGWVNEDVDGMAEVGGSIGSASIKQCRKGVTRSGRNVAIKTKKPNIEKYYKSDLEVVGKILKLLEAKYEIPSYLITEVEKIVNEELDFQREVDNQVSLRSSLDERNASMDIEIEGRSHIFPIEIAEPISIYPDSSMNDAKVGLMVEEFARGLSLKEIQKYKQAIRENDASTLQKMRKRIAELYPEQFSEMEERVKKINLDHLQAAVALELLKEIVDGGIFHADLHTGNIFYDLSPCLKDGKVYEGKVVLIDLGSMGYSRYENMPKAVRKESREGYDVRDDFRDFLSALFSQNGHTDKIAEIINKFTGLSWTKESVTELVSGGLSTQQKVKKIFYEILKDSRDQEAGVDMQFRYFLKAIATAADHLDKLKIRLTQEMKYLFSQGGQIPEEEREKMMYTVLEKEALLNFELVFG